MSDSPVQPDRTVVFTDGSARGNPGPGGWGAIVADPTGRVRELGGRAAHTTNNRMEMEAARQALELLADDPSPIDLHTDSTYLIHGVTKWMANWKRRGWRTAAGDPVANREIWEELDRLASSRPARGKVRWQHVAGHAGIPGNERADEIATTFADETPTELFDGPAEAYPVDLEALAAKPSAKRPAGSKSKASASVKARKRGKAYVYLSLLDGELVRHQTWAECEARVKGRGGARYRKALDPEDERAILNSWGIGG